MTTKLDQLVDKILERVQAEMKTSVEIEASGRHVHLSQEHLEALFGKDYELTRQKYLSQPGQFACKERVSLLGPKGSIHNVIILGPTRKETQVEISLTDALQLGIKAPVRESGDIANTPGIVLINNDKRVFLDKGVIVAKRHIHMTPEDAKKANVENQEIVQVKVNSAVRPLIFDDVVVRVSPKFATYMHIDYDEANACGFKKGLTGTIIKK